VRRRGELKIWEEKLEEKYFVKNVEGNNKEEKRRIKDLGGEVGGEVFC